MEIAKKTSFVVQGKPKAQSRPRFVPIKRKSGRVDVRVYDERATDKGIDRIQLMQQLRSQGLLRRFSGPIAIEMRFYMPKLKSYAKRLLNTPFDKKPDIDNLVKYYLDVMNDLIFNDDRQVTELWCEKIYSDTPKVEITITPKGGDMINEHVTTVKTELSLEDLNYMVRKANRLGMKDRQLIRCFMEEDDEGKHYYFECEGMKERASENED